MKLFSDALPFLKANLHTHTTCSDGRVSPEESLRRYRAEGYSILAITDHRSVTQPEHIPEGMLFVPGIELDYLLDTQAVHILGIGVGQEAAARWDRNGSPQQAIDLISGCGGRAILAHPAWSLNTPELIAGLHGLAGTEVWNSCSTFPYNAERADSSSILDITAASRGRLLRFFGNDDTHAYGSEFGGGWTMLQPETLTVKGVLDAIDAGHFFASRGPAFRQVELVGSTVHVTCSPVALVSFITNCVWREGRNVTGEGITEAEYTLRPGDRFLRVQLLDANGRPAWCSPIDLCQ